MNLSDLQEPRERGWIEFILVSPLLVVGFVARMIWIGFLTGWLMHKVKWW